MTRAAFFPRLTLTGALGFESTDIGDMLRWSSRTWLLGPMAGTMLSMPLFDGGRNRAFEASARAQYDEALAQYRQGVLVAFREVEDSLSGLRILSEQSREQTLSVETARRAAQLSNVRHPNGLVNFLEVIDAERTVLATQRAATQVERERALTTVALVRALGGVGDRRRRQDRAHCNRNLQRTFSKPPCNEAAFNWSLFQLLRNFVMNTSRDCSAAVLEFPSSHSGNSPHPTTTPGLIHRMLATLGQWRQRSRARQELAELDDYLLKDIGYSRSQAAFESGKFFWQP